MDFWDRLLQRFPGVHAEVLRRTPPRNAGGEGPAKTRFANAYRPNIREEQRVQTIRVCRYQAVHGSTPEIRANAQNKLARMS